MAAVEAPPRYLTVSLFPNETGKQPRQSTYTWPVLVNLLSEHRERETKEGGACWSPVSYLPGHTRSITGVEAIHLAVMDYDHAPWEDTRTHLASLGLECLLVSTFSSTPDAPRFRAIIPFTHPVPKAEWVETRKRLKAHIFINGDAGTDDCSRIYYLPAHPAGEPYFVEHLEGHWLDPDDLKPIVITPAPPYKGNGHSQSTIVGTVIMPDQKDWVAQMLTTVCPEHGANGLEGRDATATKLIGYFRNLQTETVTTALILTWNQTYCRPPLPEHLLRDKVHQIYTRYEGYEQTAQAIRIWSDTELMATEFPPPVWVVQDILPEGMTVLAGRPKRGKSWLALQIACAVVSGKETLGKATTLGQVVYIALEDSPKRFQSRLRLMKYTPTGRLTVLHDCPALDKGGLRYITDLVDQFNPIYLVIDTLSRILGRGRDQDNNADMTDALHPLQQLALERSIALTLVDHHRKSGGDISDTIDDIMGSTAKTGVSDCIWGLYRKSGQSTGELKITGRDIEEQELAMLWDGLHFEWRAEGTIAETTMAKRIRELLLFLDDAGGEVNRQTIERTMEISHGTAHALMKEAKARRYVQERSETMTGGGLRYLYRLTNEGKHEAMKGD
jgi:hypothetical protein